MKCSRFLRQPHQSRTNVFLSLTSNRKPAIVLCQTSTNYFPQTCLYTIRVKNRGEVRADLIQDFPRRREDSSSKSDFFAP